MENELKKSSLSRCFLRQKIQNLVFYGLTVIKYNIDSLVEVPHHTPLPNIFDTTGYYAFIDSLTSQLVRGAVDEINSTKLQI